MVNDRSDINEMEIYCGEWVGSKPLNGYQLVFSWYGQTFLR